MKNKLKVVSVVGTRPEIIRLTRVLVSLDNSESIDHIIIHTGQNYDYELNQIFFEDLKIRKPDYFLNAAGVSAVETIGKIIIKIDPIFEKEIPDAVLILGDTNSCLSAIPAKKRKIPIFHMEAGNRCFDQRVPEETNRKIVDHIADINLTYSDIAREYLLKEGIPSDRIIKTGSPMFEVLNYYLQDIKSSSILNKLKLKTNKYFVVSAHREENIENDTNFKNLTDSLNTIAEIYNFPIIVSTHPRTKKKFQSMKSNMNSNIQFLKPLGFNDYNALQLNSYAVISDSGTISEESSILNFPALNIRETHERPEAMEEASVMLVGLKPERILQGLRQLKYQMNEKERKFRNVNDYSMPNVSEKVVRIIISYVDYINRVVWNK
jgi:UDP-N-acetyl-L-fucosamine synthase